MTTKGVLVKGSWMQMPAECFEPLIFEDLKIGDAFIAMPTPGDNHGHGGFKGAHNLFIKTEGEKPKDTTDYIIKCGLARRGDGESIAFLYPTYVIKINLK